MDPKILDAFDESLARCNAKPGFLDRFYERFLAMSPKVSEKFQNTNFVRQKRALRASFHMMLLAAGDGEFGAERYLNTLAKGHSRGELDIGAEFYDYWLDSLLATVRECDKHWDHDVEAAWEMVMGVGIQYLVSHYNDPPGSP
jgi:hemoglobin-like flavoprotein